MQRILVPLDGSPFAERALPTALDLAARHGARIELIGVHQPALPVRGGQGAVVFDQRFDAELRAGVRQYLHDTVVKLRAAHPSLDFGSQRLDGTPAPAIAEYARSEHADLVVLASHGRGGPARWMMGSVADQLVRSLTIPVLVVRAEDKATVTPDMTVRSSACSWPWTAHRKAKALWQWPCALSTTPTPPSPC
ncbi:MAG: universal stress protein [Gemmatimonadaceae bacterium]|nr:universal stress protein [Gemmatimonadaceae bacterium]